LTGQWGVQLVRDTFWEQDAEIIMSMPLREDYEDYPAWFLDAKGMFSIRSAYKLLAAEGGINREREE
jgi:hypothetical protein